MTLMTVNAPRVFANTSMRPRYGLSLKRTGAFSSSEPNMTGALELKRRPEPAAKATTSRDGEVGRDDANRTLDGALAAAVVVCGSRFFATVELGGDCDTIV